MEVAERDVEARFEGVEQKNTTRAQQSAQKTAAEKWERLMDLGGDSGAKRHVDNPNDVRVCSFCSVGLDTEYACSFHAGALRLFQLLYSALSIRGDFKLSLRMHRDGLGAADALF